MRRPGSSTTISGLGASSRPIHGSRAAATTWRRASFEQLGFKLGVIGPGQPSTLYHAETEQEAFLILAGTCTAVLEDEVRELRAWDFVHCPPGTRHTFVNTSDEPCVLLMVGARTEDGSIVYPPSDVAGRLGAAVDTKTDDPGVAYANRPHWRNADGPPDAL